MQTKVSVIVLNWNGRQFLEDCLTALLRQTLLDFEIVLVENGSSDGSAEWVRQRFEVAMTEGSWPRLRLIELAENTGFAGGNLIGLQQADPTAEYIATLNNDTVPNPNWLAELLTAIESGDWAAACGPMVFASQPNIVASAGIEVRRNGLALDAGLGQPLSTYDQPHEVFGPCAGAALYRRSVLEKVGFFDPAFFAYLEDADLAWRLRLAGYKTLYTPAAVVRHVYSGTGKQGSPFKSFQLGRNRVWTIIKNTPFGLLWRNLPRIIFYDMAASGYNLLKGDIHPLRGRLAALLPHHLRRVWQQRKIIQQSRTASNPELARWLRPDQSLSANLQLRQTADKLARK